MLQTAQNKAQGITLFDHTLTHNTSALSCGTSHTSVWYTISVSEVHRATLFSSRTV